MLFVGFVLINTQILSLQFSNFIPFTTVFCPSEKINLAPYFLISQATGEAAGEDVDTDSDSDDDDDDVRVTIGDIKTGAPQYT